MTTRAAIYARFSSDLQNCRSIDDQVAACRGYAARQRLAVTEVYMDAALSGASVHGRTGFARLSEDARAGRFDAVIATDIDRFSRDVADMERFRAAMEFLGITLHTCADGSVTKLAAGFKGLMGSLYLDNLRAHTRRGMAGVARAGRAAGGLTYGYAPGAKVGERVIVEHEAKIVLRIFEEYGAGRSPRAIARALNDDNVPPPRGRDWQASAINGNRTRGSGILMNTLYDGRLIWNRVSMRKDPASGRRVSRPNPPEEWIVTAVEALRIVPAELFARVQTMKGARGKARPERSRRPRHLLAGLLRCGCCGSAMAVANATTAGRRIWCGRRKEGGRCENGKTYPLAPIEHRVVKELQAQLTDPRAIARYLETYQAERRRLARQRAGTRDDLVKRLGQVKREIDRIVDAVARGVIADADVHERLPPLRQRRAQLEAELAALAPPPAKTVELHPATVARYLESIEELKAALERRLVDGGEVLATALRDLVGAVVIHPRKGEPAIEVTGQLAALVGGDLFPQQMLPTLVAGTCYSRTQPADDALFRFAA